MEVATELEFDKVADALLPLAWHLEHSVQVSISILVIDSFRVSA